MTITLSKQASIGGDRTFGAESNGIDLRTISDAGFELRSRGRHRRRAER
ncbi:MAG TPA: hypothetical protein VH023_07530 [Rhodopila sp.]|nr:hypothetical protein [Rhodopila sp.]